MTSNFFGIEGSCPLSSSGILGSSFESALDKCSSSDACNKFEFNLKNNEYCFHKKNDGFYRPNDSNEIVGFFDEKTFVWTPSMADNVERKFAKVANINAGVDELKKFFGYSEGKVDVSKLSLGKQGENMNIDCDERLSSEILPCDGSTQVERIKKTSVCNVTTETKVGSCSQDDKKAEARRANIPLVATSVILGMLTVLSLFF